MDAATTLPPMTVGDVLLGLAATWATAVALGWLVVVPWLRRGPRDPWTALVWRFTNLYCRFWHRLRVSGREHVPAKAAAGRGLVVVANHTGSVDPLLIQAGCPFFIRWMMASDTMIPGLAGLWRFLEIVPVDRDGRDTVPLREAIRHVRGGGAIGIFPEGRITTPPRELRPFLAGVGAIVRATGAPVLLAWVHGTPDTNDMREALRTRSRARVEFIGLVEFERGTDADAIAAHLRTVLHERSGWPYNDAVLPPGGPPGLG